MRQGPNNKRMRGRGNGRKGGSSRNQSLESNGPEGKVRGSAHQIVEKYLSLARDASSTGDRVNAESYYQFAEHYFRVMNANASQEAQRAAASGESKALEEVSTIDVPEEKIEAGGTSEIAVTTSRDNGKTSPNGKSRRRAGGRGNWRSNNGNEAAEKQDQVDTSSGEDSSPEEPTETLPT